ncbi:MAG: HlyD family efflux transporter periplasmic adaptor subunit [Christensenellaceae bacterium]|jgi:multidrug efflux pump subunit AcrA (membrane-fusion protein)|nr:HlyD family efflux transporter periplasmic adaptor subunit [Christensenellaceae bacterium]
MESNLNTGGAKTAQKGMGKWPKNKLFLVGGVSLAALLIIGGTVLVALKVKATVSQVRMAETTVLKANELVDTISATGMVESAKKEYVYSTVAYTVMEVPVAVGDAVQPGAVLARLDDGGVQNNIDKTALSLDQNVKSANQQAKSVKDSYQAAMDSVRDGTNSTLISAQTGVTSAYNGYLQACNSYDNYVNSIKSMDTQIQGAENNLKIAEEALKAANKAVKDREDSIAELTIERDAIDPANTAEVQAKQTEINTKSILLIEEKSAQQQAQSACTAAKAALAQLQGTQDGIDAQRRTLQLGVSSAYDSYQNALRSLDAAISSVETQLQSSKNQLDGARITAQSAKETRALTLEQLQDSLDDTIVTAPAAGTITAAYATVGAPGNGLLFVIEDTGNLIVKTTVKAYDSGTVKEGQRVTIKSDATGDTVFEGTILSIAPTTQKTAMGDSNPASEVFETKVKINGKSEGLRIGMGVRLNYVVEEQQAALSVPYDAIYAGKGGQDCVLAAVQQLDGKYLLTEMPVVVGMENDLYVAISGEGIVEGLRVLNDPSGFKPGATIALA